MTTPMKLEKTKPRIGLMISDFSNALLEVSKVTTFDAQRHAPGTWKLALDAQDRYADDMYRHLFARHQETVDAESKLSHVAHAAWNALVLLEIEIQVAKQRAFMQRTKTGTPDADK